MIDTTSLLKAFWLLFFIIEQIIVNLIVAPIIIVTSVKATKRNRQNDKNKEILKKQTKILYSSKYQKYK